MSPREADIVLPFETADLAQRVARALAVETQDNPPRTRVAVSVEGASLRLRIDADDVRGLRAATNSYLRWADAAAEVARAAEAASESFKRPS